jgi:DNA excision repair protein ERCC-5
MFHRVRPVFVFDGTTPALKRHTQISRRRRKEANQGQMKKTAEKLLMNQLKKQVGEI